MKKAFQIALIAVATLSMVACGGKKSDKSATTTKKEAEKVKVQTLAKERISKVLDLSGTLEGYETMNVSPSITGHIEHIYVEVGSQVNKGSNLARMDQTQYNTTLINLNSTKVELDRVEALKASGNVSQQTYDQLKATYDQLSETARFQKENTFVTAPFAGVISAKNYQDGEMYSGSPILVLTQINRLKTLINIPESYFPLIKAGMKVNITSDIYPGTVFPASIEIVYPTIDPNTHTFQCKVAIPNGNQRLRPGMYVKSTLAIGEVDAIVVPYQAVLKLTGSNERYVFVNQNGTAHRVSVTMGQRFDDKIEVLPVAAGELNEGDQLIVTGQGRLVDGCALEIVNE